MTPIMQETCVPSFLLCALCTMKVLLQCPHGAHRTQRGGPKIFRSGLLHRLAASEVLGLVASGEVWAVESIMHCGQALASVHPALYTRAVLQNG